ncbi:hypothetical protein Tco_1285758 [Tanacetum coccineum]
MHNNIMAAGFKDRHLLLATGRYAQWRSRFLTIQLIQAIEDSLAVPEQTTFETAMNMTPKNKAHFESEKEAIHLILTGIGDEIYSTVDACQTAQRQTYFGSLVNSPLTMEKQLSLTTQDSTR